MRQIFHWAVNQKKQALRLKLTTFTCAAKEQKFKEVLLLLAMFWSSLFVWIYRPDAYSVRYTILDFSPINNSSFG